LAKETEAHADDEMIQMNNETVHHITRKDGRSAKVTNLFRMADALRVKVAKRKGHHLK
jgi:hypothetical protein